MIKITDRLAAACATVIVCGSVSWLYAQDDLDDLLKELETTPPAAAPAVAPAATPAPAEPEAQPAPLPQPGPEPAPAPAPAPVPEPPPAVLPEIPAAEPVTVPALEPQQSETLPAVVEPAPAEEPAVAEPAAPAADTSAFTIESLLAELKDDEPAKGAEIGVKPAEVSPVRPGAVSGGGFTPVAKTETPVAEPAPAVEPAVATPEAPAAAAPAPAPAPAPDALANLDPVVREIVMLEQIRRQAMERQAQEELNRAREALLNGEFSIAFANFKLAERHLDVNRKSERDECRKGMAQSKFELAKIEKNNGNVEKARELAEEARSYGSMSADGLLASLRDKTVYDDRVDRSATSQRLNEEEYKARREQVRKYLKDSRSRMAVGELDRAMELCEVVLVIEPYNREAITLRDQIAERRQAILRIEAEANRKEMIARVDQAKRMAYAANAPELKIDSGSTTKRAVGDDPRRSVEQDIEKRMKEMILPSISFKAPMTISDAVDQFRQLSRDYDRQDLPMEQRGINIVLDTGKIITSAPTAAAPVDDFAAPVEAPADTGFPVIPNVNVSNQSLWDALKIVCDVTGFKFKVNGSIVKVMPKDMPDSELITRSYNVMDNFMQRVSEASADMTSMSGPSNGGGWTSGGDSSSNESGTVDESRSFFEGMGVKFPPQASIHYIKAIGKLRVTNTAENLAVLEQVLNDLNVTPTLIEVETRFVEVAQEDLNSLGFEWILNSDYSINVGHKLAKALNLKEGKWYTQTSTSTLGTSTGSTSDGTTGLSTGSSTGTSTGGSIDTSSSTATVDVWTRSDGSGRRMGVSATGDGTYSTGHRFLSDDSNPISGSGKSTNDKFMKLSAFLGNADLSLILHMLAQRSDTDLLSAPKVTTKSGQEAVIKVVKEYIYPTDYDVTISTSNGGSYSNGRVLAVVEPQNFTMREVGVILRVTPEVTAEGQMINLDLNPEVISEPEWRNYGMKIPIDNSSNTILNSNMLNQLDALGNDALNALALGNNSNQEQQYYEAPMEQPFFQRRAIQTHLSVYNGATVVMGGLITEERKTMDDKIPFLGDLPFVGRLFRSRSEWSSKRNLLVFVTARLVDPRGREVTTGQGDGLGASAAPEGTVTPAPAAP